MADKPTTGTIEIGLKTKTSKSRSFDRRWILLPATFIVVVLLWAIGVWLFKPPDYLFPGPAAVGRSLKNMAGQPRFWNNVGVTTWEAVSGYLLGSAAGIILGVLLSESKFLNDTIYPYVVALQALPKTALAPLFVAWLGFGLSSKILTAALVALFPVVVNVIEGLRASNPAQIELITVAAGSRWQVFRYVKVPNSLPFLLAGLEIGIVMAMTGAVVAEWVGAKSGLGQQMLTYIYEFNISGMFAVLLVISVLGFLLDLIVRITRRRVVFWVD